MADGVQVMSTLKEIANNLARKAPGIVDLVTDKAPILDRVRWVAASHGLWNVGEVLDDIKGAGFVELNAPLPEMAVSSNLVQTNVSIMGGELEVPKDTSDQFGGAAAYFARKEPYVFRQAGMDTEKKLYYDYWLRAAVRKGLVTDLGGAAAGSGDTGLYSILVVRLDQDANVGIYDPNQFDTGRLLRITPLNGGNLYHLRSRPGVEGYGVSYRGRFGWQLLDPAKTVHALVNISLDGDASHIPTTRQIDGAIDAVRGTPADTLILGRPRVLSAVFGGIKDTVVQMTTTDTRLNTIVSHYNNIPLIQSYNLSSGNEPHVG